MSFRLVRNLGLGFIALIILAISLFSFLAHQKAIAVLDYIVNIEEEKLSRWSAIAELASQVENNFYHLLLKQSEFMSSLDSLLEVLNSEIKGLEGLILGPRDKENIDNIKKEKKKFEDVFFAYTQKIEDGYGGISAQDMEELALGAAADMVGVARSAVREAYAGIRRENAQLLSQMKRVNKILIVALLAGIFFVMALASFLGMALSEPIIRLTTAMARVAKGDLSFRIQRINNDEMGVLGKAFNKMTDDLERVNQQLKSAQAQVVQTAKMAALGELAGGVAHEINNPLTGVLNNVQLIKMLAQEKKDFNIEEFRELLNVISDSALRCKNITHALLDFSHISRGVFGPASLNMLIEQILMLVEHELRLENIPIKKEFEPGLPPISGDAQLLQQVIFNFISNAKWAVRERFSSKEGGVITIKTYSDKDKGLVYISVSDNGIGIAKENMERMFEPFFTTKPMGKGTGLGLSVVYNIIKTHNGAVSVESEVNKGATFRAVFPVKEKLSTDV